MEMPALRLDQKECITTGKFPSVPVPRAFPRAVLGAAYRGGGARAGPGCGGGGRAGGGRSRSKMAAQRRSLLQSVSGIFPPPPCIRTPQVGARESPGFLLTRPPRCRVGRGKFPRRGVVGGCPSAPCAASRQGIPDCGGPCAISDPHAGLAGRSAAHGGRQVGGEAVPVCGFQGAPLCEGAAGICRPSERWRPQGCL